ncbi:TetR family transcriptional regulator [Nocardia sp. CC213A]
MSSGGRRNKGPGAAAGNRAAIVAAARILFAESGFDVPMSAIARAAGVGQGCCIGTFPRGRVSRWRRSTRTSRRSRGWRRIRGGRSMNCWGRSSSSSPTRRRSSRSSTRWIRRMSG